MPTRRPSLDFAVGVDSPLFLRNNSVLTTMFAALSSTFPPGEREFVRSVMLYADDVDGELALRVAEFVKQEGQHSSQHSRANAWLDTLGFDATGAMTWMTQHVADHAQGSPRDVRLAATVGLEHLTAVLAHFILSRPDLWEDTPEPVRELLLWHAVEEIEHKSVAFDVYERCVGDRDLLRRVFAVTTASFATTVVRLQRRMLKSIDHRPSLREWADATAFLFGRRGMVPSIARHYGDFYRRDFHPWDTDDRDLIEMWKAAHPELG